MRDSKVDNEQQIRELTLKGEEQLMMEQSHYIHTINDFVELIVIYGWDTVIGDLRAAMGEKQW